MWCRLSRGFQPTERIWNYKLFFFWFYLNSIFNLGDCSFIWANLKIIKKNICECPKAIPIKCVNFARIYSILTQKFAHGNRIWHFTEIRFDINLLWTETVSNQLKTCFSTELNLIGKPNGLIQIPQNVYVDIASNLINTITISQRTSMPAHMHNPHTC